MSILIKKSASLIRRNLIILVCTLAAGWLVWHGLSFAANVDLLAGLMCIALGFCLALTGIAAAGEN